MSAQSKWSISKVPTEIGNRILGFLTLRERDQLMAQGVKEKEKENEPSLLTTTSSILKRWDGDDTLSVQQVEEATKAWNYGRLRVKHYRLMPRTLNAQSALRWACMNGKAELVDWILTSKSAVKDSDSIDTGPSPLIQMAADKGHAEVVRILLRDSRIDPQVNSNVAIRFAANKGHTEVVKVLLEDGRANPRAVDDEAFRMSVINGHNQVFKLLYPLVRDDEGVDSAYNTLPTLRSSLRIAAVNENLEIMEILLRDKRLDPGYGDNIIIRDLASNNKVKSLALLLSLCRDKVDPGAIQNEAVRHASEKGFLKVVKMLFEDPRVDPSDSQNYALRGAVKSGKIELVKLLLEDKRVDPSAENWECIYSICGQENAEMMKLFTRHPKMNFPSLLKSMSVLNYAIIKMLLADAAESSGSPFDPSFEDNYLVRRAAEEGDYHLVKLLISHPLVKPGAMDNYALRLATLKGHHYVVQLLLQDGRADPTVDSNLPLLIASLRGDVKIMEMLKRDTRVLSSLLLKGLMSPPSTEDGGAQLAKRMVVGTKRDPSAHNCLVFRLAAEFGHSSIVESLLSVQGVDPTAEDNYAFRKAAGNGHLRVLQLLLSPAPALAGDEKSKWPQWFSKLKRASKSLESCTLDQSNNNCFTAIDPSARDNEAFRSAASNGHIQVLKFLLALPSVNPSALDNEALRVASENGHSEVVEFLLSQTDSDPTSQSNYALRKACANGHLSVVKVLLEHPAVDPSAEKNEAIRVAVSSPEVNQVIPLVKLLLAHPRVNPIDMDNAAYRNALRTRNVELIELMKADERIQAYLQEHAEEELERYRSQMFDMVY